MSRKYLLLVLVPVLVLVTGLAVPALSRAQAVPPVISQEYFIQQAIDEDLLITTSAFEAEFESRVAGPNGEVLLLSSIPGSRIVPIFQYIYAPKSARQLDIEVTSSLYTGRTEFGIELARLKPWDSRSKTLSQAYKLLSFGMEASSDDSQSNWTVKINSLVNAAALFQQFGMREMQFWANYLTAQLIYSHLHDYTIVYSMTRDILAELKGARLQKIELATLLLQGQALIGLRKTAALDLTADKSDPVQSVLMQTAQLAETMGFLFEQASALYASGLEYADQSLNSKALGQFQLAVQIADSVGSVEFATAVRESIVKIHTIQGDGLATSEVLQEIESQLVEDGGGDELALNQLAQARLLISSYQYGEALKVLTGALKYENNSAVLRQINFELAKVFYETGRLKDAMTYLELAGINPESSQGRRSNPVVDVGEGLRVMADIYRMQGEFNKMQDARSAQGQYRPVPDQYLYDQGLDAIARTGRYRQQGASFFKQSHTAAIAAGHGDIERLARLQYCALVGTEAEPCSKAVLKSAYEWLLSAGVPRFATEAMFLWAQILVADGQRSAALVVFDRLVDEIHLLRYSLAGVLGAWYWERHEQVFETWLGMLVADTGARGRADASDSLLALSKIRMIESLTGSELDQTNASKETDLLRDQLAQRAKPGAGQTVYALDGKINAALDALRGGFHRNFEYLSSAGLQKYLGSLTNDEMILTFHVSPAMAQVWVGQKGRVQRRDIANPGDLYKLLQSTRQGLANIGLVAFDRKMDDLGKRLIAPVDDLLAETIYWIPAGPLMGLPLDALRLNGRYLAERHTVVNLLSFPSNTSPANSLQAGPLQKIFLAGNPQDYSSDYATRFETSAEIRTVADIFIGPGLQIVQGVALLPDEFQAGYILESNLLHLSMPGVINLEYSYDSGLELSESEYQPGRMVLWPADIRSQKLVAGLVFMSSTRVTENPLSVFSSQVGLVSDFMAAGARSVIANFWAAGAESNGIFVADFYRTLKASGDIAESLRQSKLQYLKINRAEGLYDWAGYQLFIR